MGFWHEKTGMIIKDHAGKMMGKEEFTRPTLFR